MRIAIDENVPIAVVIKLLREGHNVFLPHQGEPDASWLARALKRKSELFLSNDKEVIDFCKYRNKMYYVYDFVINKEVHVQNIIKQIELLGKLK